MSSGEVWLRLCERWRIETDRARFYFQFGRENDDELGCVLGACGNSVKSYLEGPASHRFYAAATSVRRPQTARLLSGQFPEWIKRTTEEADRLCLHIVSLLGYRNVSLGSDINWNFDPVSDYEWPRRFWANYDLIHSKAADPKVIHELNRHQHLPRIAKAYFVTGDERYAREVVSQWNSWIDQAPPGSGIQWESSLEIAIRAISWMWTIFFLSPSSAFDESCCRRIIQSLFRQLNHIYRYPSVFSSPNTHLLGEAAALFMAGLLFPEVSSASEWRRFGALTLVEEMAKQVTEEGVYREASTYYHCYATDFYLQALTLARVNRFPFPDWMWRRLEQMLEYVLHVSRPDGAIPLIGDDDGGRALALRRQDYSSYRDGLACGAVLFGREDFKYGANAFAEETMWLLGPESCDVYKSIHKTSALALHRSYSSSGCFIQRSDSGPAASHLIFDCGDLGMLSGGHGHADALSFTLFTDGKDFLIDPATAVYNTAPHWRNFFRSTRAHNTVVVDGLDQAEPAGAFAWKRKPASRIVSSRTLPGMDYIEAEHDGYARLRQSIVHRRRLLFVRPDYWIVLDELAGHGEHTFDFLFHFAPGAELFIVDDERRGEVDCRAVCGLASLQLHMYGSAPVRVTATCGEIRPIQGWASTGYGQRYPSPVLTATVHSVAPVLMMTFLAPKSAGPASHRIATYGNHTIAAALSTPTSEDICVFSPDSEPVQFQHCSMQGEVFWMRTVGGQLRQLIGINAMRFSLDQETFFEQDTPIPYVIVHLWENGMVIERGENEGKLYVRDLRYRQFQRH